jgi:hypothetical protein
MTKNITITDPLVGLSILPLKHRQEVLKLVNKGAMEVVIYMLKKSFVAGVIIMLLSAIIPFLRLFLRKGEEVDAFKERTVNVAKDITSYAATATIS